MAFSMPVEDRLASVERYVVGFMAQERELQHVLRDVMSMKKDLDEIKISLQNVMFMCKVRAEERQLQDTVKYIESIKSEIKSDVEDISSLKAKIEEISTRDHGNEVPKLNAGEEVSAEVAIAVHGAEAGDVVIALHGSKEEAQQFTRAEEAGEDAKIINDMSDRKSAEQFPALEARLVKVEAELAAVSSLMPDASLSLSGVTEAKENDDVREPKLDQPSTAGSPVDAHSHSASNILERDSYTVVESVWDTPLVIGLPILSCTSSLLLVVLLMLNLIVQLLFSIIVLLNFGEQKYILEDLERLEFFRSFVAHDVKNTVSLWPASLASRICQTDVSLQVAAHQVKIVEDIGLYWHHAIFDGRLMCITSVFCWWLHVFRELIDLHVLVRASFHIAAESTCLNIMGSGFQLQSLSSLRLLAVIVVSVCRGIIAGILLVVGTIWLQNTQVIESLVLNAIALEFIMSLDDVIFYVLAPFRAKKILSNMKPLYTSSMKGLSHLGVSSWARTVLLCSGVVTVYILAILPTASFTKDVSQTLCSGKVNFVYGLNSMGMVYVHDEMQSTSDILEQFDKADPRWQAVRQAMEGIPKKDWQYAFYAADLNALRVIDAKSPQDAVDEINPKCEDLLVDTAPAQLTGPLQAFFRWYSGDLSIEFCTHVEPYCNSNFANVSQRAAMLCPRTCGCDLPTSGSMRLITPGCPLYCKSFREVRISKIEKCQDQEVLDSDLWISWLREADGIADNAFVKELREKGCSALQTSATSSSVDSVELGPSAACAGTGRWSELKPLAPLCPSSCGCDRVGDMPLPSHCPTICHTCMKRFDSVDSQQRDAETRIFAFGSFQTQVECQDAYAEYTGMMNKFSNILQNTVLNESLREAGAEELCAAFTAVISCLGQLSADCSPRIEKVLFEPSNPKCHEEWSDSSRPYSGGLCQGTTLVRSLSERGHFEWNFLTPLGGFPIGINASCITQICAKWSNADASVWDATQNAYVTAKDPVCKVWNRTLNS